jgi:hypothetical protein
MDDATMSLLKAAAPLTVGTELAAVLSGKMDGPAAKQAALRILRLAAVLGAVAGTRRVALGAEAPASAVAAAASVAAIVAQLQTSCFHWTGAVYMALRAAGE